MKTFTELRNAQSVTIAYDGTNPRPPMFCYLKPYFNDPNKSTFGNSQTENSDERIRDDPSIPEAIEH